MAKKKPAPVIWTADVEERTFGTQWTIRRGVALVAFVQKLRKERDTVFPFQVYQAVTGQGPARPGTYLGATYAAKTALEAAREFEAEIY